MRRALAQPSFLCARTAAAGSSLLLFLHAVQRVLGTLKCMAHGSQLKRKRTHEASGKG